MNEQLLCPICNDKLVCKYFILCCRNKLPLINNIDYHVEYHYTLEYDLYGTIEEANFIVNNKLFKLINCKETSVMQILNDDNIYETLIALDFRIPISKSSIERLLRMKSFI